MVWGQREATLRKVGRPEYRTLLRAALEHPGVVVTPTPFPCQGRSAEGRYQGGRHGYFHSIYYYGFVTPDSLAILIIAFPPMAENFMLLSRQFHTFCLTMETGFSLLPFFSLGALSTSSGQRTGVWAWCGLQGRVQSQEAGAVPAVST